MTKVRTIMMLALVVSALSLAGCSNNCCPNPCNEPNPCCNEPNPCNECNTCDPCDPCGAPAAAPAAAPAPGNAGGAACGGAGGS